MQNHFFLKSSSVGLLKSVRYWESQKTVVLVKEIYGIAPLPTGLVGWACSSSGGFMSRNNAKHRTRIWSSF